MDELRPVTRRTAIKDMGKAGLAIVIFGTACTSDDSASTTAAGQTTSTGPSVSLTTVTAATTKPDETEGTEWTRVEMPIVSAYILSRDGEATLVDTGQGGAEGAIETALSNIGLSWGSVSHIVLTHKHGDHVGSAVAVAELAPDATVSAGAGDVSAIAGLPKGAPRPVGDGDNVFDLEIIETPGHTPGHISVLDPVAGILVAGDAMNTVGGTLNSADPSFTEDVARAEASVKRLAGFEFDVVLVGHGDPILENGTALVTNLAAGLTG